MAEKSPAGKVFGHRYYKFPAVAFHRDAGRVVVAHFNHASLPLFKDVDFVDIEKSNRIMVFRVKDKIGVGAFAVTHKKDGVAVRAHDFEGCGVEGKTFKLYRCAQGYAIRLDEPIKVKEEKQSGKFV